MKKILTLCLVLAFAVSGVIACKKTSGNADPSYTQQQEEAEIDEIIATEEEEAIDADTGTITDEAAGEEAPEAPAETE